MPYKTLVYKSHSDLKDHLIDPSDEMENRFELLDCSLRESTIDRCAIHLYADSDCDCTMETRDSGPV